MSPAHSFPPGNVKTYGKPCHSFPSALKSYNQASCFRVSPFPCSDSEEAFFSFCQSTFFLLLHIPLKYHDEFKLHYSVLMIEQNSESFYFLSFCLLKCGKIFTRNCISIFWPMYRPTCLLKCFSPRWDTFSFKVLKRNQR